MRKSNYDTMDAIVRPVREANPQHHNDGFDTPWRIVTGFLGSLMPIGANIPWLGIHGQWRFCPLRPLKSSVIYLGVPASFMFFGGCMASRVNQNPVATGNPFTDAGYSAGVNWVNPSVNVGLQTTEQTVQVLWDRGGDAYEASLVNLDNAIQGRYAPMATDPQTQSVPNPTTPEVAPSPVPGTDSRGVTTVNFSTVGGR
ncbi:MAG: hypothetical protein SWY16_08195 [Cyanobacteriota bacterium]|nr:hypothetical protein [Cyanobacteriota bacterium]